MSIKRNTSGLKAHGDKVHAELTVRVNKAIDKLKKSKTINFNFSTVAKEAMVSRATLYDNDENGENGVFEDRIRGVMLSKKAANQKSENPPKDISKLKDEKIKALYDKVKTLDNDLNKAMFNLVEMEGLKKEIERLNRLLEKADKRERGLIDKVKLING